MVLKHFLSDYIADISIVNFKNMARLLFPALILSFHLTLSQTKKEDEQLIRESRRASNEAIAKRDIEGVSKFWMKDFVQVRGNGTAMTGKDSIILIWKKMFKSNPETSFVRNPTEIIISESDPAMAWETGKWIGINSYSKGGNYSAMWRKKEGVWKLQSELFVSLR